MHMRKSGRRRFRRQAGYVLLLVLFMIALVSLVVITAAPSMVTQIRRDREEELIHRGNQYSKAIRRFYKKFGRYPNSVKDLLDTNHLRFLRREYKDPMTDDGKWELIHLGQSHFTPTGLFGKTLAPTSGPLGSNPSSGSGAAGGNAASPDAGSNPSAGNPSTSANAATNPTTPDSNQPGQTTAPGSMTGASGGIGGIFSSAQPLGGGPIVGVASTSKQKSIKEINKKDHYNEWEFVYDPRMELPLTFPAQPVNGTPGALGQPNPSNTPNPGGMTTPK